VTSLRWIYFIVQTCSELHPLFSRYNDESVTLAAHRT